MAFPRKPDAKLAPAGLEARIRRAAERQGVRAIKSRWRRGTDANLGGWQILDKGSVVWGRSFDLTDAEALAILESD